MLEISLLQFFYVLSQAPLLRFAMKVF